MLGGWGHRAGCGVLTCSQGGSTWGCSMSRGCSGGGAMLGLSGAGKGARWGPGAVACSWGQCSAWAAGPLPAARPLPQRSSRGWGWGCLSQGRAGPCCCQELQEAPAGPSRIRELREAPSLPAEDRACPGQGPPAHGAPLPPQGPGNSSQQRGTGTGTRTRGTASAGTGPSPALDAEGEAPGMWGEPQHGLCPLPAPPVWGRVKASREPG